MIGRAAHLKYARIGLLEPALVVLVVGEVDSVLAADSEADLAGEVVALEDVADLEGDLAVAVAVTGVVVVVMEELPVAATKPEWEQ